jgi:hypothetical protein
LPTVRGPLLLLGNVRQIAVMAGVASLTAMRLVLAHADS